MPSGAAGPSNLTFPHPNHSPDPTPPDEASRRSGEEPGSAQSLSFFFKALLAAVTDWFALFFSAAVSLAFSSVTSFS